MNKLTITHKGLQSLLGGFLGGGEDRQRKGDGAGGLLGDILGG